MESHSGSKTQKMSKKYLKDQDRALSLCSDFAHTKVTIAKTIISNTTFLCFNKPHLYSVFVQEYLVPDISGFFASHQQNPTTSSLSLLSWSRLF